MNIPNVITLTRIILIPVFVLVYYLPVQGNHIAAACIFALASLTDWLDGYLARKLKQVSPLGTFLDPVADKLMVAVALVLVVGEPHLRYLTIPAAIIVGREIVISALREWMAEVGRRASVAVSMLGKIKTFIQMLALIFLLIFHDGDTAILIIGYLLLYTAAILTLTTMVMYLKAAWPDLTLSDKK